MGADVRQGRLHGPQHGGLHGLGDRDRLAHDLDVRGHGRPGGGLPVGEPGDRALERLDEGRRPGAAQVADEAAGLGEVLGGRGAHGLHALPGEGGVGGVERVLGRARDQHDRGQPLGEGVVDLAGEPLPLGAHPRPVLRARELRLRSAQLLGHGPLALGLGVQGAVRPGEHHGHGGAHQRADHGRHPHAAGARRHPGHHDGGHRHHQRGPDHVAHPRLPGHPVDHVQDDEEEGEGDPREVAVVAHEQAPQQQHQGQPGDRRTAADVVAPGPPAPLQHGPGQVDARQRGGQQHQGGGRERTGRVRGPVRERARQPHGEQRGERDVQGHAQAGEHGGGAGLGGHGGAGGDGHGSTLGRAPDATAARGPGAAPLRRRDQPFG